MGPAAKANEVRVLTGTAKEMLNHARGLIEQAGKPDLAEEQREQLRVEADQWLDRAKTMAESANRLAR